MSTRGIYGVAGAAAMALAFSCMAGGEEQPPRDPASITAAMLRTAGQKRLLRIAMVDCIAYALRKNPDIRIARIEPKVASDDVRVAQSAFEPALNGEYTLHDKTTESTNIFFPADERFRDINFSAGISGKLQTGTEYRLDFLNQRYRSNSFVSSINPYYAAEPIATLTQPLFRGFGITVNRADIIIAQNTQKQSVEAFKTTAMDVVSQAKTAYLAYAYAIEAYDIATRFVGSAQELLEINRARYAKGLASSVDLLESEAAVAEREKTLLSAEYAVKTAEDRLKHVTNIGQDPAFWNAEIEPLEKPEFKVEQLDLVKSITDAFANRPDYQSKLLDLKSRDIRIKVTKNALLPTVDVVGSFGMNGLSDTYEAAWNKINKNFLDWTVGGTLNVPWGMGDRARYDRTKLEKARALVELERLEQNIILEVRDKVRDADIQFRQEGVARVSREKERENYAAQQERFAAGQVSTHDMLDYQYNRSKAELDYTQAIVRYATALISLDREVGLTLAKNNVRMEDISDEHN